MVTVMVVLYYNLLQIQNIHLDKPLSVLIKNLCENSQHFFYHNEMVIQKTGEPNYLYNFFKTNDSFFFFRLFRFVRSARYVA